MAYFLLNRENSKKDLTYTYDPFETLMYRGFEAREECSKHLP